MKVIYRLGLLRLCGSGSLRGYAPSAEPVGSGRFEELSLEQFAQQLAAQTSYRSFFYSTAACSVSVTLPAQPPLSDVLCQTLDTRGWRFAIDEEQNVFRYTGTECSVALPSGFFWTGTAAAPAASPPAASAPSARHQLSLAV